MSWRTEISGIWLSEADGSNAELLFSHEGPVFSGSPRWSPDGQRIVFDSNPEGQTDVYVTSARGGNPIRLTSHPADDSLASWSRDGEWIYVTSRRGGRDQIWRMPAGGGEPVQVTRNGGRVALESADGKFLYHTKDDQETTGLWKVPVGGGEETQVLESVHTRNFYVTPQGIYFIQVPNTDDPDRSYLLRFFGFATERVETITLLPPRVYRYSGLTVSPDGRPMLYAQSDQESSEDLILVENFR